MPDDPDKTLQELRQRIATEGLPKLSAEALRVVQARGAASSQAGAADCVQASAQPVPRSTPTVLST